MTIEAVRKGSEEILMAGERRHDVTGLQKMLIVSVCIRIEIR